MHFDLNDKAAYLRWREHKLERSQAITPVVEIADPNALTPAERTELLSRIDACNMALYACRSEMDESAVQRLAAQLGLIRLDANWLSDEAGISRITVNPDAPKGYIPYTNLAIKWHTDGYYNPPERRIRGMVLHCVHNAASGGENRLLDHEIAYLMLRDADPDFIRALSAPDAMTIPERTDEHGVARGAQSGPVFSLQDGELHMRYTARTRSILWHDDARAAAAQLERILSSDMAHVRHIAMEAGMGLICNNVLHDRSAFTDDPEKPRLLYRARYLDRVGV